MGIYEKSTCASTFYQQPTDKRQRRERGRDRDRGRKTETKAEVYKEKKFLSSIHNNIKMYQIPEGKTLIDALFTIPAMTKTVQRRYLKC